MKSDPAPSEPSALSRWRKRRAAKGFVRVEVQVSRDDADLVRAVASALGDPARRVETRAILRERIAPRTAGGLKALLAAAPLDGLEFDRPRDQGRDVAL